MFPELKAIIRKFGSNVQGGLTTLRMTFNESLAVALTEGEGDEMTRGGLRYAFGFTSAITGQAPVVALPTTTAQWLLWNPAANPNTIFIDELSIVLVSGTAAAVSTLWVGGRKVFLAGSLSTITSANVPSTNATGMVTTNEGVQVASNSQLVIGSNVTIVAGSPIENVIDAPGATLASESVLTLGASNRDIRGKIALPPGTGYALTVFAASGTSNLYAPTGKYREYATQNQ